MLLPLRHITIGPRFRLRKGRLTIRTGWLSFLLSLGLRWQVVEIDSRSGSVVVRSRILGVPSGRREIPLSAVEDVETSYDNVFPDWFSSTVIECYTLDLRLTDGDALRLFSWTGNMHSSGLSDFVGMDAQRTSAPLTESRTLAAILRAMMQGAHT